MRLRTQNAFSPWKDFLTSVCFLHVHDPVEPHIKVNRLTVVCETKWNETKWKETKWNETTWDETKWKSVVCEMKICSLRNENL